ncbi:MAG: pyridoxamine 5'-phosphate oxidase family protein [Nocardioides sp.]
MSNAPSWSGGRLIELPEQECWELIASRPVGRVAFDDGAGPTVLPVNHAVVAQAVRFRTAPHSALAAHLDGQRVAFEVDDVDEFHQSGWSVLVRGRARLLDRADSQDQEEPAPWPAGQRPLLVEIETFSVTGRRLLAT